MQRTLISEPRYRQPPGVCVKPRAGGNQRDHDRTYRAKRRLSGAVVQLRRSGHRCRYRTGPFNTCGWTYQPDPQGFQLDCLKQASSTPPQAVSQKKALIAPLTRSMSTPTPITSSILWKSTLTNAWRYWTASRRTTARRWMPWKALA